MTLAILSPGPAIIAAIQTAFSRGREVALPFGMGLAFGASLWGLFALAGLAVIFKLHPELYRFVKIIGGVYLLWMSWGLWRAATLPLPEAAEKRFGRGFWGGVLLNLSNPKPALFYSALLLSLFPGPLSLAKQASIYATALSTELFWPEDFGQTVQEAFGLTAAEVEIVRGITLGLPLKDIAEQRGRSIETVRTQARSILAKTETHSQSELVRVVLGLLYWPVTEIEGGEEAIVRRFVAPLFG